MFRITKRTVDGLKPGEVAWDGKLPGFGVRRRAGEARWYVLKYRARRRQRWYTIGRHGAPWTPEKARVEAKRLLGMVADGKDPAGRRDRECESGTLAELAERYIRDHAEAHKKPSSVAEDRRNFDNHLLPVLGHLGLAEVTRGDIARFHAGMRDKPIAANRCLALLSKMMNLAEKWGERPEGSNPCRHVEKYRERKRERFLSESELAALGEALADAERDASAPAAALAAIRLLIFTGARRSEILTLKWEHVDFERVCLRLPESKTGAKIIPLNAPALALLDALPRIVGNPYVLPGLRKGEHLVGLNHVWLGIRARAGLAGVRLHDLRHSFASAGAGAGLGLPIIGALLGHSQPQTTARYAHLASDPLRQASELIGKRIAAAMDGGRDGGAQVVPLKPAGQDHVRRG